MTLDNQRLKPFLCSSFIPPSNSLDLELFKVSRVFQLQSEEQLFIKSAGCEDYLCIVSGKITIIDPQGEVYQLDAQQSSSQKAYIMPNYVHLFQVKAEVDSVFYHVDSEKLDYLVFWEELKRTMDEKGGQLRKRMDKLRHFLVLQRLPTESVFEAIRRMKVIDVKTGDEIVREGEQGDAFYVIDSGRAEVWQTGFYDDKPKKVTVLGEGEVFGEDAIVTGGTRNATIKMIEDGQLLVLNQSDFLELVSNPMIREVEAGVAKAMIENGYKVLDVRCEEEHAVSHIPDAISFPLHQLRQRIGELEPNLRYVTYCRSGKRSAVAAFLLNQRKIEAVSLKGGLLNWPFDLRCWHLSLELPKSSSHRFPNCY